MNLYAPISVYTGAFDHSGRQMPLADFMRLGHDQYSGKIQAIRSLKESIRQYKDKRSGWQERIKELESVLEREANPFGGEEPTSVIEARTLLEQARASEKVLSEDIERLDQQQQAMKRSIPCATISGCFAPTRAKSNLQQHSGFICVDIDDHVNLKVKGEDRSYSQSLDRVPSILQEMPWVLYAAHSVGGVGYFCIIPVAQMPLDGKSVDESQQWYYECLDEEFQQYGITIDPACKDVTRLRFASFDEHPYRNAHAIEYAGNADFVTRKQRKEQEAERARRIMAQARRAEMAQDKSRIYDHARHCADVILRRHINMCDQYDTWFDVAASLAAGLGESGRQIFHDVSSTSSKYNRADADRKYDNVLKGSGSMTIATFFAICRDAGVTFYE